MNQETTQTTQITPELHPETWELLQPPEEKPAVAEEKPVVADTPIPYGWDKV